jgi:hypothetical protein
MTAVPSKSVFPNIFLLGAQPDLSKTRDGTLQNFEHMLNKTINDEAVCACVCGYMLGFPFTKDKI